MGGLPPLSRSTPYAQLWGTPGEAAAVWIAKVETTLWFGLLDSEPVHATVVTGAI